MSGFIYCFNTHENPNIIKAGHTQQEVQKRLRGYMGPTKPRSIIFTLKVDDSVEAEKMMLQLMEQCVSLNKRYDLGNEWFETTGNFNFEQRAGHLQTIAKIVQKASSIPSSIPSRIPPSIPPSVQDVQGNSLHIFLTDCNNKLEFHPDYYISQPEFQRLYKQYCKSNEITARTLKRDFYEGPFLKRNITVVREIKMDPMENVPKQGTWICGVREMRDDALEFFSLPE